MSDTFCDFAKKRHGALHNQIIKLKPWKVKEWVIPPENNGEFVANMERVLDTYKLPYDEDFPVVCMDESPKQLIEELSSTPIRKGQEARVDYEYILKTHGASALYETFAPEEAKRLWDRFEFIYTP